MFKSISGPVRCLIPNMNTHICSQALAFTRHQGDMNLSAHMPLVKFSMFRILLAAELQLFSYKGQDGS